MISIKKLLTSLSMMLVVALPAMSQTTVSGTVTNVETGEPIPGVNITVKGQNFIGTATNANGFYSLNVPSPQDTLVFSFIGYLKKEIPARGRTTVNVALSPNVQQLEDIVVIGYGTREKEDNTGSVTVINSEDFKGGAITSPGELFQGKIAGVSVTSSDGAPGSGPVIRIRGGSSLSASNAPLFVIDGVPVGGGGISGMRNPLNTINPSDIASITILKDASATAIYGSRASNGVIIITTKEGRPGQPLSVTYSTNISYQRIKDKVDVLSADQFRTVIGNKFGQNGTKYLGNANTNWQDRIYDPAFSQDHHLSFSGSFNKLPYRVSLGFAGNNGILRTSHMDRFTGTISLSPALFNDQLEMDINLKGMRVKNQFANQAAIGNAIVFDPTKPIKIDSANAPWAGYYTWVDSDGNLIPIAPDNPVALLEQTNNTSDVYRSIGNIRLDYELPFIPNFSTVLNLGYDYSKVGNGLYAVPANAAFADNGSLATGILREYTQKRENELLDLYFKYQKTLTAIESTIHFTGGYSWEHHYSQGTTYATNFNRADTTVINQNTDYETEFYLVSFFGRLNYTLKDKYLLTATLRQDGTSRFSKENRWGLFPSLAVAWKIHEEPFLQNAGALTKLKLRLGYGITGQQRIGQGNYTYLAKYTYSEPSASYQFGNEFIRTLRPEGYNADLKWEETTTYNIGLDYGFFNNRIIGSIDAYYRETNDLLNVIPVPAGTNFTNLILSNVGSLVVKGIEFNITGRPVSTEDTFWEISFNATHNVNEITKLTTVSNPNYIGVETGGISGGTGNTIQIHSVGFPRNSFYVFEQVYDENGNPIEGLYVDRNNDGIINSEDKYRYENPSPDFILGISSRLNYKNWNFSFAARAFIGNYVYNNVASSNAFYNDLLYTQYIRNTPTSIFKTSFYNAQFYSDLYVENASFFRMDNVSLGYDFTDVFNSSTSLGVSATVQNVFVITDYRGLDPEVFGGIDNNLYPRPRTFVLGLTVNF